MKTFFVTLALAVLSVSAWGDELTKAVQQKLKDQGFFYGEASGQPGSETDAAIRRYQIRYGLKVTGALNDETIHSLGLKVGDYPPPQNATRGASTPATTPKPQATAPQALPPRSNPSPTPRPHLAVPRPTPSEEVRPKVQPQTPTYRTQPEESAPNEETPENEPPRHGYNNGPSGGGGYGNPYGGPSYGGGGPSYGGGGPSYGGGGPSYGGGGPSYGRVPGQGRPRVVARVQMELARRGFYHGPVDGELGGATVDAIGRFQASQGLPPTGHLNGRTLLALHVVRKAYRVYSPYGPYRPYGPYGPRPYGPYGPYGPYARNYW
jgi:peptidoglycan hydrolase-like protein with peptidoglycan-binding domain